MHHAVIMAGGKGERFWPKSRIRRPKQFLGLLGNESMIQAAVRRIQKLIPYDNIYIVTNEMYRGLIREQLPMINDENIIIEPISKNTAACVGLACAYISSRDSDASMAVLPSDHLIKDEEGFADVLARAFRKAEETDCLITLGIKPNYPETGYGYIRLGCMEDDFFYRAESFTEKPGPERAKGYVEGGNYLWNSGMFVWKCGAIMRSFEKYMPVLYQGIIKIEYAIGKKDQCKIIQEEFAKLESISIDYGIMEKADNIYVIPGYFGWDDVGSWTSLERLSSQDKAGNVVHGNVVGFDTYRCIVKGEKKLIATVGVEDLIVIDTDDVILICKKDKVQDIKQLIKEMKEKQLESFL